MRLYLYEISVVIIIIIIEALIFPHSFSVITQSKMHTCKSKKYIYTIYIYDNEAYRNDEEMIIAVAG